MLETGLPPHDIEAEESVLASLMLNRDAPATLAGSLAGEDFFREKNGWVWAASMRLYERGVAINTRTVAHELEVTGQLNDVGGRDYLSQIVASCPVSVGDAPRFYAAIVKDSATYRAVIQRAHGLIKRAYEAPAEVDEVFAKFEEDFYALRGKRGLGPQVVSAGEAAREAADNMLPFLSDPMRIGGYETGWWSLDSMVDGLVPGRLITLGAATSVGKSLCAQNMVRELARQGLPVLMFTTEMGAAEVHRRLTYMEARVDPLAVRLRGEAYTREIQAVNQSLDQGSYWPITYVPGKQTTGTVRSLVRRYVTLHGVKVVVVDHMGQGFVSGNGNTEQERIGDTTSTLKTLAEDEGVVVVAVSHVNRSASREGRMLQLSDLYMSTHIEQDSDQVVLLTPCDLTEEGPRALSEHQAKTQKRDAGGVYVWFDVAKNRHGGSGGFPMYLNWKADGGRFIDDVKKPAVKEASA